MNFRRNFFRPHVECLESRLTPSNFTVSFSPRTHTLTITGDSANNDFDVRGEVGDLTKFHLTSATDTFNGVAGPYDSVTGVKNITISMGDGDDSVEFAYSIPSEVYVRGNLSVNGGAGANAVFATNLTVGKNFTITNATNSTGTDSNELLNLIVGGALKINNGDGDTYNYIRRDDASISTVGGDLSITNGSGQDTTSIVDMNVGGNVVVKNGHADGGGIAGLTNFYNSFHTSYRSLIKGNVSVSYLDGRSSIYDAIFDTIIQGNVTFNHGSGDFATKFDGYVTSLPVVIRGNLTMNGSGHNSVRAGIQYNKTGLLVAKNLTINGGAGNDTLELKKLEVDGATRLNLGDGANIVNIDDSTFAGTFRLTTGAGADKVYLDTAPGSGGPTTFERAVVIILGAGADGVTLADTSANKLVIIDSSFIIHHGDAVGDSLTVPVPWQVLFPFGGSVQWII